MSKNAAPYSVTIGGQKADPYRILQAYGITNACQQHALKKLLRAGRSHKTLDEDISEVILTLERWKEMLREDGSKGGSELPDSFRTFCPICACLSPDMWFSLEHNCNVCYNCRTRPA